jgi:hypothetical protein
MSHKKSSESKDLVKVKYEPDKGKWYKYTDKAKKYDGILKAPKNSLKYIGICTKDDNPDWLFDDGKKIRYVYQHQDLDGYKYGFVEIESPVDTASSLFSNATGKNVPFEIKELIGTYMRTKKNGGKKLYKRKKTQRRKRRHY